MRSLVAVVAVVLALVACAGDEPQAIEDDSVATEATAEDRATMSPSPSAGDLGDVLASGTWRTGNRVEWQFFVDGTYTVQDDRYETGTWALDGAVLTIVTDDGTQYCEGTTATYELTAVSTQEIAVEVLDDPCEPRNGSIRARGLKLHED